MIFATLLSILDWILFVLLGLSILYLFVFALASMRRRTYTFAPAPVRHRFVIFIPGYKEDRVLEEAVDAALDQDYPRESFEVVVIADHCGERLLESLRRKPVRLLDVAFEDSSKAKALNYALDSLGEEPFEVAVILDADNTVERDFLTRLNDAYHSGAQAIQAHRRAKNLNTDTAILDAASEEINNSIFRRGHVALGISSALIGSGMAFDYGWFRENARKISTAGEDKELEVLLLKQGVFIEYLDDLVVLDEKIQQGRSFYNQRRRWLSAQFYSLFSGLRDLPGALISGNVDYADKLVQWMMPPRILLMGGVPLWALVMTIFDAPASIKWWVLLMLLLFSLAFALPDYLVTKEFKRALRKAPLLFVLMALNLFRMRGAHKKFIHTDHGSQADV